LVAEDQDRFRYAVDSGEAASLVDVVRAPNGRAGRVLVGTVHHIAWRTPDDDQQLRWLTELSRLDYNVSPVMDRKYFHSIYYREPGNILFEIATDPPGFGVDEPMQDLGTKLVLPPWLEGDRAKLEATLPPLRLPVREESIV
jgi:glyoxalase family protein